MCRLLGWVEDRPVSVEEVLGPDGLAGFTSLTAVHDDGWGMAWREGDVTRTVTSPESAGADHLKALSRIARVLRDSETVSKIRGSNDAAAIYTFLAQTPASHAA
jgi:predicted glutamine amidotransferase